MDGQALDPAHVSLSTMIGRVILMGKRLTGLVSCIKKYFGVM